MVSSSTLSRITLIATGNLATLALGGGIIALFAHNWDDFPKAVRVLLSFLPVLLGIGAFAYSEIKHGSSVVWMECVSLFLALMMGSTMGLITQVYNMGGSLEDFLFAWLVLILPVIYVGRSSSTAIFYLLLSLVWLYLTYLNSFNLFRFNSGVGDEVLWFWVFLAGIVPHFLMHVKTDQISYRGLVLGWTIGIVLIFSGSIGFSGHRLLNNIMLITLVYAAGKTFYGQGKTVWQRPFQSLSILATLVFSLIISSKGYLTFALERDGYLQEEVPEFMKEMWQGAGSPSHEWLYYFNLVLLFASALLSGILFRKQLEKSKDLNYMQWSFPLVMVVAILLALPDWEIIPRVWLNLFLLALAGWYLKYGIERKMGALVFYGILVFAATLLFRYFDMSIAFWLKGIIYVALGTGFLFFNNFYSKKLEE